MAGERIHPGIGEIVPISTLRPYARNPRNGDTDAVLASLEAHGQYRPIMVRRQTNEVLAGNHTYAEALELGWEQIAVTWVECDEDQAAKIVLVDNRTADLGVTDNATLLELLGIAEGPVGTGYSDSDVKRLLGEATSDDGWGTGEEEDDEAVTPPAEPADRVEFRIGEFRVNVTMRQFNEWAHEVELLGGSIEARKRLGL